MPTPNEGSLLTIGQLAAQAGLNTSHIRALADEKLPHIDALIARARAVRHWLEVAQHCDCESVDVCGLFVDPTLLPPAADIDLDRPVGGQREQRAKGGWG